MVNNGDIIKLKSVPYYSCDPHYIVVKHEEQYLLLSLETLNRKTEFSHEIAYDKNTGLNAKDINLEGIIESYIECNEPEVEEIEEYQPGLILRNSYDSRHYGCIVVDSTNKTFFDRLNLNEPNRWQYYIIDLASITLSPIDFEDVRLNYVTYKDFGFKDLKIKLR